MAAGMGSRMNPVTLETPKPLVRVNGVRFIDTIINKMLLAGIQEIYIVRGYLKEKFDELLVDYPFLHFVDNDLYNKENNISSAMKVINLFENAYVCDADLLIMSDDVFPRYQEETNYLVSKVEETDDWCFDLDKDGYLCNYRKGGKDCYQAYCLTYWTIKDAKKLKKYLTKMYHIKGNKQKFWEMCMFDVYKDKFKIKPRLIEQGSIKEIDSLDELIAEDSSYIRFKREEKRV